MLFRKHEKRYHVGSERDQIVTTENQSDLTMQAETDIKLVRWKQYDIKS